MKRLVLRKEVKEMLDNIFFMFSIGFYSMLICMVTIEIFIRYF